MGKIPQFCSKHTVEPAVRLIFQNRSGADVLFNDLLPPIGVPFVGHADLNVQPFPVRDDAKRFSRMPILRSGLLQEARHLHQELLDRNL